MYSFTSRIRYSETDEHSYLTAEGVLDYFQDCSSFEGEDNGISIEYMAERELVWVLSSWQIVINRYPRIGENIEVTTIPYEIKGCFGFRNYVMKNEAGETLAYANAMCSLISTEDHKPRRASKEMCDAYQLTERIEMDYAPRKIDVLGDGEARDKIVVKLGHIDSNNHVNNGKYIRIAMDSLNEEDAVREEHVEQIRAQYKMEAHLGDEIYPRVINGENTVVISLEDAEGKPYAIVELKGKE